MPGSRLRKAKRVIFEALACFSSTLVNLRSLRSIRGCISGRSSDLSSSLNCQERTETMAISFSSSSLSSFFTCAAIRLMLLLRNTRFSPSSNLFLNCNRSIKKGSPEIDPESGFLFRLCSCFILSASSSSRRRTISKWFQTVSNWFCRPFQTSDIHKPMRNWLTDAVLRDFPEI